MELYRCPENLKRAFSVLTQTPLLHGVSLHEAVAGVSKLKRLVGASRLLARLQVLTAVPQVAPQQSLVQLL